MAHEVQEQVELAHGQLHLLSSDGGPPGARVHLQVAEGDRRLELWRALNPPQHGVDARDQLGRGEGLDDVVVGAKLQPRDPVRVLALRGEQDHRHARPLAVLPQPPHDLQPVHAGEHQVEHDEVGSLLAGATQRARTVARDPGGVSGALEVAGNDVGDGRLVVYDQDGAAAAHDPDCGNGVRARRRTRSANRSAEPPKRTALASSQRSR